MTIRNFFALLIIWGVLQSNLSASPVLYRPDLWTDAAATWVVSSVVPNDGTPSEVAGTTLNAAAVLFSGGGQTPAASVAATSGIFLGNLQNLELSVNFTFNSIDMAPASQQGSLALYFKAGANVWYYDSLYPPTTVGLTQYSVFMGSQGLWTQIAGAGGASYWNDLGAVTEFGFEIRGANQYANQTYEILDVYFSVPEPETVWMILMVLASLGITFRARLTELGKQALVRIKS